jgi:DNA adenine methylase
MHRRTVGPQVGIDGIPIEHNKNIVKSYCDYANSYLLVLSLNKLTIDCRSHKGRFKISAGFNTLLENEHQIEPFLKWAGGKRWFVSKFFEYFPKEYDRYIEPFLGGGAVFFALRPSAAILADVNPRLIETYQAIQCDWNAVWRCLRRHHRNHSEHYYYKERSTVRVVTHEKAAQFLYLNRTCWNGLYQVNKQGEFNVPIGTKKWAISDSDDFESVSLALGRANITCNQFESTISVAGKGDFLFVDPPYTVAHNFNGFVKYNESMFTWNDQIKLRDALLAATKRGAQVLMTNADHESIWGLYKGLAKIDRVHRQSIIGSKANYRRATTELAIRFA